MFKSAIEHQEEQISLIRAKLEDIQFGTRNFELFKLEEQVAKLNSEMKYASLPGQLILKGKIKKMKQQIQEIRMSNKEIRRQMHIMGYDKPEEAKKSSLVDKDGNPLSM